ncbi:MAG: mechanosensitive ion channel family protein [Bacteroidales bacterium]|nr:mechanosensitive ion channel family protein [Bacteroidales bacterium]
MDQIIAGAKEFLSAVLFKNIPTIIIALLVLWIGWKLIKYFNRFLDKIYEKKNFDPSLRSFLRSVINITLKVLLLLTVMNMVGIAATSFIAMLGAAGLAVGMALQGTLQNFAGGIIILSLKPYKVGDYIEQGSYAGTVQDIRIFSTILTTLDNKIVVVPNTDLATKSLVNYTRAETRRVDVNVGIAYGQSVDKAREVMTNLANNHPLTLQEPAKPVVHLIELSESAVSLQLRFWVKATDYWTALFDLNQQVYDTFNKEGIVIPFKQVTVHLENK